MSSTTTNVLKKTRDGTYNPDNDGPEINGHTSTGVHPTQSAVTNVTAEVERALEHSTATDVPTIRNMPIKLISPVMPIKLTSKGAIQLTASSDTTKASQPDHSPTLVHLISDNPFFHEKRRWEDSFDTAEKQALPGNIVKAAKDKNGDTYVTLQEEEFVKTITPPRETCKISSKPNSIHEDDSQDSDGVESTISKKPGRKPMPDEEVTSDSEQDPKIKRKAQNRAAQRAFRERKERYVKELESRIKQVQDAHFIATAHLVQENQQLRAIIYKLESENCALKGIPIQPYQHLYQAPHPPQNLQVQHQLRMNNDNNTIATSGASYPNIAPLLPNTSAASVSSNNQPMILPAYLPSTSSTINSVNSSAAVSPLIHTASPSVNQMLMLASGSFQQYPMSPVVTTDVARTNNNVSQQQTPSSTASGTTSVLASATKKSHKNNQPLEYTFSISTPASLRPHNGNSSSSASKNQRSEHIEPVPLYPPGLIHQQKRKTQVSPQQQNQKDHQQTQDRQQAAVEATSIRNPEPLTGATESNANDSTANTPSSSTSTHQDSLQHQNQVASTDDACSIVSDKTASTANTQKKKMQELELDLFDCHIDTEGQIFCERLKNEVCNDAFDRLLSEPLFDQMGKLNLSISDYPVRIVTAPMSSSHPSFEQQKKKNNADPNTHQKDSNSSSTDSLNRGNSQGESVDEQQQRANEDSCTNDTLTGHNHPLSMNPLNDTEATMPVTTSSESQPQGANNSLKQHSNKHSDDNGTDITISGRLLTSQEIWFTLSRHKKFPQFTTNQLCHAVKELAKCSDHGPVLDESDLELILAKMEQGDI